MNISKREKELEKLSLTFKELKKAILKVPARGELTQASIVILRHVFIKEWEKIK